MSSNLPKNFNTQLIINNIALIFASSKIDSYDEDNYTCLAESMIQLHNNVSAIAGHNTKINLLKGIDWNTGKVTDFNALTETSDSQIDAVQVRALVDMEKLIIQQQKYKNEPIPERIIELQEAIMDEYHSIGYKSVDRMVTIKSENMRSLMAVAEIFLSHAELSTYVDMISDGNKIEINFPRSYTESVLSQLDDFNGYCENDSEHITIENVVATAPYIHGMKDIHSVEKKRAMAEDANAELSI